MTAFAGDPHAAGRFNDALHTAELTAEGAVLIGGTVRLLASSEAGYTLEIRDGGADGPKTPPAGCSPGWAWRGRES